jgi:hypothetical protein
MRSTHRRLSGICLILYAFVAVGLPLGDALLAASGGPIAAHVEDATNRHGGGHDHVTCQICRVIDRNVTTGGGDALAAFVPADHARAIAPAPQIAPAPPSGRTSEARAPPRA